MRGAVGEVHMKMIDAVARKKVRKVKRIARALFGLETRTVFPLVLIDKRTGPFPGRFSVFIPKF